MSIVKMCKNCNDGFAVTEGGLCMICDEAYSKGLPLPEPGLAPETQKVSAVQARPLVPFPQASAT